MRKSKTSKSPKTIEQVESEFRSVHGDTYDYSEFEFHNMNDQSTVICSEHGPWQISAHSHFIKQSRCKQCHIESLKMDINEFKRLAAIEHDNFYGYDNVVYDNARTHVQIDCPTHGLWKQVPHIHLKGNGCPKCGDEKTAISLEELRERGAEIHENFYKYHSIYKSTQYRCAIIECPVHGVFHQKVRLHLEGSGCKECATDTRRSSPEEYFKKVTIIHDGLYDYSDSVYIDHRTPMNIGCSIHGLFSQKPASHAQGKGCPRCRDDARRSTPERYFELANKANNNFFIYTDSVFTKWGDPITVRCPDHGLFTTKSTNHATRGGGCPKCKRHKGEIDIMKILEGHNINYKHQKKFPGLKRIKPLFYDFYLIDHNILIEYDGKQHYIMVPRYGGEEEFEIRKERDRIKNKYADDNNIPLLRIPYWLNGETEALIMKFINKHSSINQ